MADELTYPEVVEIADGDAKLKGLLMASTERDESLFVNISRPRMSGVDSRRNNVVFWTSGTGAFLVDFDDRWSWQVMAYDRMNQVDAVHEIMKVADRYLRGAGEEQATKSRLWPTKQVIIMDIDGERIVLQAKRPGPR